MRHVVIDHRINLRGMEIGSRTRITEAFAFRLLIAIVLMETEVSAAAFIAGVVALPVCHAARRRLWRLREGVVATDTFDLEGNIVRLGLRVRLGPGLVRLGEAIAAGFLEQVRWGRGAQISDGY